MGVSYVPTGTAFSATFIAAFSKFAQGIEQAIAALGPKRPTVIHLDFTGAVIDARDRPGEQLREAVLRLRSKANG